MCILDLSKELMYEFHYNYIKNKYCNNSRLSYTDTDNLIYEIKTEDVSEGFNSNKEMFDFSNYSIKSKYYDNSNKLVIGKMRDETSGITIKEFVGLTPRMYSLGDNSEYEKAKGVNRNVVAPLSHNEYKDVLLNKNCVKYSMNRIQSKDHRIETYDINKISLSCFNDKIYIQNNGYDGLALGYYS